MVYVLVGVGGCWWVLVGGGGWWWWYDAWVVCVSVVEGQKEALIFWGKWVGGDEVNVDLHMEDNNTVYRI